MRNFKRRPDLTLAERQELYRLREHGYGIREISRIIGRAASKVSTELKRHRKGRSWMSLPWYEKARVADKSVKERRGRSRVRSWGLKNETIRQYLHVSLMNKLSPKSISFSLAKTHPGQSISHESIYQYIYNQERSLLEHLVFYGKTKRTGRGRKYQSGLRAAVIDKKRRIDKRHLEADKREEFGHQESDFIVSARGGKGCLMVVVEGKSGYVQLRKTISGNTPLESFTAKLNAFE